MPSLRDREAVVEVRTEVRSLRRLAPVLAQVLAERGLGGQELERCLAEGIEARCIACGMEATGSDLVAAGIASESGAHLTFRQDRLRLGYCARKGCESRFYQVRLLGDGVPWGAVWPRAVALLSVEGPALEEHPPRSTARVLAGWAWEWARHPLVMVVLSVMILGFIWRSGCRVPGVSPKERVFVVPESDAGVSGRRR